MKLSLKISLLSIGLTAATLLLCGVIVLRSVYRRSLDAVRETAYAQLGYMADTFAFAADWEGADGMSDRAARNRFQYLFRRIGQGDAPCQLTYRGETLYSGTDLALDRLLTEGDERLIETNGQYGVVLRRALDNGCTIYLLYDCTEMMQTQASLRRLLLTVGSATFVGMAAAMLLLTYAALLPLKELERAARRMAAGDYETPISVRHRDEVGSLAQSFETMRGAVQAHTAELSDLAEERQLLLGALTHEMKTPMTAIVGYSEALQTLRLSPEQRSECIEYLHRESRRLESLTQKMMRLITLTSGEEIESAPVSGAALDAILRPMLVPLAERGGVALSIDLKGFAAVGDADLLCSVLTNLYDNAASAGAKRVALLGVGNRLTVTDDGAGMTPDVLARVTEPFYRADKARGRAGGHAGLGLSLVQRIVSLHSGTLAMESAPGAGTTVTVVLPNGQSEGTV